MKNAALLITLIALAFLVVACGAPVGDNAQAPGIVSTSQVDSPAATLTEVQVEPLISAPGVGTIKLLTGTEGSGARPPFMWEAITGADHYQLLVFDEAGEPYWAWEGIKTQIYMGGTETQPPDDSSGPSIRPGYTWAVVGYDSQDKVSAISGACPISP